MLSIREKLLRKPDTNLSREPILSNMISIFKHNISQNASFRTRLLNNFKVKIVPFEGILFIPRVYRNKFIVQDHENSDLKVWLSTRIGANFLSFHRPRI